MSVLFRLLLLASSVFAVACVEGGLDEDFVEQEASRLGSGGCPELACGSGGNSPKIDNYESHDFPMVIDPAVKNTAGFTLVSVTYAGAPQTMRVSKSELEITDVATGTVRRGAAAAGTNALIYNAQSDKYYTLTFQSRGQGTFWATPGGVSKSTPTYLLRVKPGKPDQSGEYENICSNPVGGEVGGIPGDRVVLFETDRINSRMKTVFAQDARFYNVGCVDHALFKLHMTGHTQAAQNITASDPVGQKFQTKPTQRQAFLKMITGDYCGTGDAFTVAGQPLLYGDYRGWMKLPTPLPALEARWDEHGAQCLNTPRIDANPTAEGIAEFGGKVVDAIASVCKIPKCTGDASSFGTSWWVSANP